MVFLGCKPDGRHTEQHDVFFGIGESMKDLAPHLKDFWPEAMDKLQVDAWREVTCVDGYQITISEKVRQQAPPDPGRLFFINLGGYQRDIFDEPHFKLLTIQRDLGEAILFAKTTAFFKTIRFAGANSHVDDKYGVDVDDLFEVGEILPAAQKKVYQIVISKSMRGIANDEIHLGYFKLNAL